MQQFRVDQASSETISEQQRHGQLQPTAPQRAAPPAPAVDLAPPVLGMQNPEPARAHDHRRVLPGVRPWPGLQPAADSAEAAAAMAGYPPHAITREPGMTTVMRNLRTM